MYVEDPIKLNREEFTLLMEDTDRHRICWMFHDVLSDQQIARLFSRLGRTVDENGENQTVMAWVAPCQKENCQYLLFKWYDDFYDPPERIELFILSRQPGNGGEPIIQPVQMGFSHQLGERGANWYRNMWGLVSDNAGWFFGEADFEEEAMIHILQQVTSSRGQEMEVFEWYYHHRSDGELSLQCRAIEAYFRSIQIVDEVIRSILEDPDAYRISDASAQVLNDILDRMASEVDVNRVGNYAFSFARMADGFFRQPLRSPELNRNAVRQLGTLTERGEIHWTHLRENVSHDILRELYFQCNPPGMWDVFQPWRTETYFTVLRRSAGVELHRGVYLLTKFVDQHGRYITELFWLENTTTCVAHLCGGEFFGDLAAMISNGYVREAELSELDEISVDHIYHILKDVDEEANEKKRRRQ